MDLCAPDGEPQAPTQFAQAASREHQRTIREPVFVAAGGGGDAVGVLLARNVLQSHADEPALISTCAWERLRIDPTPGPRLRAEFQGLAPVGSTPAEILATSDTIPPGRSVLPRLAAETTARLFLHDFGGGAVGLSRQLLDLVTAVEADSLTVLDVGGDIVAKGHEPTLLSPLADSLTLAGCLRTGLPTRLAVLGPGADGELPADDVARTLGRVGGVKAASLGPDDVQPLRSILSWHPTEATTLVAAAALGLAGAPRLEDFPLAAALTATDSLTAAEAVMQRVAVNELDYERRRAADLRVDNTAGNPLEEVAADSRARGATYLTTRRLFETTRSDLTDRDDAKVDGLGLWKADALG